MNLRTAHIGGHVFELDESLEILVLCVILRVRFDCFSSDGSSCRCREFEAIYTELEALLPKKGKGPFERVLYWGKNVYSASSVKKKLVKLHERVRDAQHKFLVCYAIHDCFFVPCIECFSR